MSCPQREGEYEILLVDDGSSDGSLDVMTRLAEQDPAVRVIELARNFGQTAALDAGLNLATGDVIVTLDADLQNDPADIPRLLDKLEEGYDLVYGWRKDRHDRFVTRRLPSAIANRLIQRVTGFPAHDIGCTLKALRRDTARQLKLYGEMHRFIPILAHAGGARCAELVVRHHPRRFGRTKYGLGRTLRVAVDLLLVQFLTRYASCPMRLFGPLGIAGFALAGYGRSGRTGDELPGRRAADGQRAVGRSGDWSTGRSSIAGDGVGGRSGDAHVLREPRGAALLDTSRQLSLCARPLAKATLSQSAFRRAIVLGLNSTAAWPEHTALRSNRMAA